MAEDVDRAEQIYAGLAAMERGAPRRSRIGVAEFVRYLCDPGFQMPDDALADLGRNPASRALMDRLAQDLSVATIPVLAAASDADEPLTRGPVVRPFVGGRLELHPTARTGVYQLQVKWDVPRAESQPLVLFLEAPGREAVRFALPEASPEGRIAIILAEARADHRPLIAAIVDPDTRGRIFLQSLLEADEDGAQSDD